MLFFGAALIVVETSDLRILVIGLDGRVLTPETPSYSVTWAREMGRLVDEYVVLGEDRSRHHRGPVPVAPNVTAWPVHGHPAGYSIGAARLAHRLHRRSPFDVCTTEDPFRAGVAGALFAMWTGVPLNVENHSSHLRNPAWVSQRTANRVYHPAGIRVVQRADTVRNYSPDQTAALMELGLEPRRLFVIPPPAPPPQDIDRDEARAALGLDPDLPVIFTAGRLDPLKNLPSLLRAFAILHARRPARLLIAGNGPQRTHALSVARALGVEGSVHFLGMVPESQMPLLYAAADMFATASHHETGPRTVLEAYAAGCPVVGTYAMGVVHYRILCHGETGLVVNPADAPGISEAMEMLLDDPAWARQMAAEGRRRIRNYAYPEIARRMLAMFEETVRRGEGQTLSEQDTTHPIRA